MRILIVGGGGREHALVWRLARSACVERLFAIPGNPGIAKIAQCLPCDDLDPETILGAAEAVDADLTVVGPEAPLVAGVVDRFRAANRAIVGPAADAARLEGSKVFAKNFFRRHRIPTADFETVDNEADARRALDRFGLPVVIKTDGLAAGKGVIIARERAEADRAYEALGPKVVIEEFLEGEEVSFIALCDGKNAIPFIPSQDHKAVFDGDRGPNTGGMGAYCDARILTAEQTGTILDTIMLPTVHATRFTGFLYAGLMMTRLGPRVLEFNVRLGDPETQVLMHSLDCDFAEILTACARGDASSCVLKYSGRPAVCVVLASGGYPGVFASGLPIAGIDAAEAAGSTVFHAGTRMGPSGLETAGGRVLGVTASGDNLHGAMSTVYAGVSKIRFPGMHYRTDIARRYNAGSGT
ncbi:MAG: phosphoribosylamine--glycine ligase [Acidobacteriota bacterium]|nr:phosphoribosylamine--glycine ligase [Acidobacteriota bacterium]